MLLRLQSLTIVFSRASGRSTAGIAYPCDVCSKLLVETLQLWGNMNDFVRHLTNSGPTNYANMCCLTLLNTDCPSVDDVFVSRLPQAEVLYLRNVSGDLG